MLHNTQSSKPWSIIGSTVVLILTTLAIPVLVWPPKVYMATRPTVTIEDIEDSVRTEVQERHQDNQERLLDAGADSRDGENSPTLRSAHANMEVQQAKVIVPEKTVILHSWLGGKIVIKRVGTQLYLSLFK